MTKGITAAESLVIVVTVFIAALIIAPLLVKRSRDKKIHTAEMGAGRIASAILDFYRDTGYYPVRRQGNNDSPSATYMVLASKGTMPISSNWWSKQPVDTFENHLNLNTPGYPTEGKFAWRGPYLEPLVGEDPWGHSYVFNAVALKPRGGQTVGLVVSAGPNGVINTEFFQSGAAILLGKDDIASRVR